MRPDLHRTYDLLIFDVDTDEHLASLDLKAPPDDLGQHIEAAMAGWAARQGYALHELDHSVRLRLN